MYKAPLSERELEELRRLSDTELGRRLTLSTKAQDWGMRSAIKDERDRRWNERERSS